MFPFAIGLKWVGRRIRCTALWALLPILSPAAQGADPVDPVRDKLRETAAALRATGAGLNDADFELATNEKPPDAVAAAGSEFVAAWREYRRAMSVKIKLGPHPVRQQGKNVVTDRGEYQQLISELLDGNRPPVPEQIAQFFYTDYSWCGTPAGEFASANHQAILLACLRHQRFGEALRMVMMAPGDPKTRADLLTAFGFDWRKVAAGEWLAGRFGTSESLCMDASDDTARLFLRWAELHWDKEVTQRDEQRRTGIYKGTPGVRLPTFELLHLLRSDNTVSHATKERVATFLNANATRLYDAIPWLQRLNRLPRDIIPRLRPMILAALQHEKNEARRLAEQLLREAGETNLKAELRPSPKFRLFVNGQTWPVFVNGLLRPGTIGGFRPNLGLSVKYAQGSATGGLATSPDSDRDGNIEPDADAFIPPEHVRRAHFYSFPSSGQSTSNPDAPWIRAEIPLPPKFGEVTDVRVDTVEVTIQPRFPRPPNEYNAKVTDVEFGYRGEEGTLPLLCKYHLEGSGPLTLKLVQPGEYLLRVTSPGAAAMPLKKVRVSNETTRFEPELAIGSTVTVPLVWPDGLELAALDPEMADIFRRSSWAGLPDFFIFERNGKPFTETFRVIPPLQHERDSKSNGILLPNLPTGKYLIRLRSGDDIRSAIQYRSKPDRIYPSWNKAEVSFAVEDTSPGEFAAPPIRIEKGH